MSAANGRSLSNALFGVICWWFGCRPDYEHPCELSPNYLVPCRRCGSRDTTYADRVGDTRHAALVAWLKHWLLRRWMPARCSDCGKRFGEHDKCLPF